jgi:type II secretory pathway predicted ATPase ExeA
MYELFYGLKEKPFTLLPDPDYLYLSPKHQRALTLLEYGLMSQAAFSVICGDTGAGKTTLIRRLLAGLGEETTVGLITNTHKSFGDLLNWVLMAFGIDSEGKSKAQMHQIFITFLIEQYAQNRRTVLIVDEAQNMNAETLEELRMLSNINADKDQVLQVILSGQPVLRDTLRKPELMQFAQRISVDYYLESLCKKETKNYINFRLKVAGADKPIFTDAACDAVYRYSGGTPRLINLLCDTALVYGFAEQTDSIDAILIDDVIREQHSNSIVPTFNQPLTDEDITKLERDAVKPVVEAAAIKEDVMAEMAKRTRQGGANYDTLSVAAQTELESEAGVKTSAHENIETSKVTPIKQDTGNREDISVEKQGAAIDKHMAAEELDTTNKIKAAIDQVDAMEQLSAQHNSQIKNHGARQEAHGEETTPLQQEASFEEVVRAKYKSAETTKEDVAYPIIHLKDESSKNIKVLALGFIGGLVLASILSIGGAYLLFGDKLLNTTEHEKPVTEKPVSYSEISRQGEIERIKLEAMEKERDAAVAITRALERERDAALAAAKAQQSMREVEKRAAKIIAEQERKTTQKLDSAAKRARQAEQATAIAKQSENEARLQAMQTKIKAMEQLKVMRQADVVLAQPAAPEASPLPVPPQPTVAVRQPETIAKEINKPAKFSANPCSSPSAKFLSTCKK